MLHSKSQEKFYSKKCRVKNEEKAWVRASGWQMLCRSGVPESGMRGTMAGS